MKLTIEITADDGNTLGEALQKVVDRIGVGVTKERQATDEWWYDFKIKKRLVMVMTSHFIEFGEFKKGDDYYEMAIVHAPFEIRDMYQEDIDAIEPTTDWLILDDFKGEIVHPAKGLHRP